MRISDWSSDVCSSDLVQRQQAGQEHRHPEYAGRDLCQRSWFVAQCKGEQHDYEEGEQGGLQGVAAAAPEEAEVADDQRLGGRPDHRRAPPATPTAPYVGATPPPPFSLCRGIPIGSALACTPGTHAPLV